MALQGFTSPWCPFLLLISFFQTSKSHCAEIQKSRPYIFSLFNLMGICEKVNLCISIPLYYMRILYNNVHNIVQSVDKPCSWFSSIGRIRWCDRTRPIFPSNNQHTDKKNKYIERYELTLRIFLLSTKNCYFLMNYITFLKRYNFWQIIFSQTNATWI